MNDHANAIDSDSDISSNSSWTVLEGTTETLSPDSEPEKEHDIEELALPLTEFSELSDGEDRDEETINDADVKTETTMEPETIEYGCSTFEEYLKERDLDLTYECDSRRSSYLDLNSRNGKPGKQKKKKCNAGESLGTLTIISTVLAIAGVSFLCLLTARGYALTASEIERIKTEVNSPEFLKLIENTTPEDKTNPSCQVLLKNNKASLYDNDSSLKECLKKNSTSPQRARKALKSNKLFKTTKTINLLDKMEDKNPPDNGTIRDVRYGPITYEDYLEEQHSKTVQEQRTKTLEKQRSKTLGGQPKKPAIEKPKNSAARDLKKPEKLLNPASATKVEEKKVKEKKAAEVKITMPRVSAAPVTEEIDTNQTKIACNIIQDLMLLRMTSKVSRRLKERQDKRPTKAEKKPTKIDRKTLRLKKQNPSMVSLAPTPPTPPPTPESTKPQNSRSTLKLLDELPFSKHKKVVKTSLRKLAIENSALERRKLALKACQTDEIRKAAPRVPKTSEKIKSDFEKLRTKQMEFLEKLRKQQADRIEYLQEAREQQQKSVNAIINYRSTQRLPPTIPITGVPKEASCGRYSVPLPNPADVKKKLLEIQKRDSSAGFRFPRNYCSKQIISETRFPDVCYYYRPADSGCATNHPETYKEVKTHNSCCQLSSDYVNIKKKYYETIGNYWIKREEYLERRMRFMDEVSNMIRETMKNLKNKESAATGSTKSQTALQTITEALAVFPDDSGIQKLHQEFKQEFKQELKRPEFSPKFSVENSFQFGSATQGEESEKENPFHKFSNSQPHSPNPFA